jgi:MerR family transcriptional regulator, copper efflux regulator
VKIREVAEQCDVNVQTIRFYERRGLLRDPRRGVGGYREYDDGDVERLRFIRQAQTLGFTLREVEELLAVRAGTGSAADVKARAREKLASVRDKIAALRRLERVLVQHVATCPGRGALESCPILQGIERAVAGPTQSPTSAHARKGRSSR